MTSSRLAFNAMDYAHFRHKGQVRKYTGNPYTDHLAEVVAITMTANLALFPVELDEVMATAWLHDVVEDTNATIHGVYEIFGPFVGKGVELLTDTEVGNRAKRKQLAMERLVRAPGWVQTIKIADLISNTPSIRKHDPGFAPVYLKEAMVLATHLTSSDPSLRSYLFKVLEE